jgi:hypothetical protein
MAERQGDDTRRVTMTLAAKVTAPSREKRLRVTMVTMVTVVSGDRPRALHHDPGESCALKGDGGGVALNWFSSFQERKNRTVTIVTIVTRSRFAAIPTVTMVRTRPSPSSPRPSPGGLLC